jgi:glycine cleavage system H lipoate-binding protein
MRASETPGHYLVGAPRGRLTQLEDSFLTQPWSQVREQVQVKLVEQDGEVYVLARSEGRRAKEKSMRRKRLKRLVKRLKDIRAQKRLTRTKLLMKLGAAQHAAGNAYSILDIHVPEEGQPITAETFMFTVNRQKLREARRREGGYLLRSNLTNDDPAKLWLFYLQLIEVEQAFKELKNDLSVRPIYHQLEHRIEAHIFIAFMAYCLQVTLKQYTKALAPGLTPRSVIEKLALIQMIDVHLPTTDGRHVILSRYTEPEKDQMLLLQRLKLELPAQPKPKITKEELKKSA